MKLAPVTFDDYSNLLPFFRRQTFRLCEYSLPSFIAWRTEAYQPVAAVKGEFLITGMEFTEKTENRHLMLPLSVNGMFSPEQLRDLADELDYPQFWYVPEDYINTYGRDRVAACFTVSRQTEYDDYVYSSEDLVSLKGNRYAKKRNLLHQFNRAYWDRGRVKVEELTPSVSAESIDFIDMWCEERGCDSDTDFGLACEREAMIHLIEHMEAVEVDGVIVRVDGDVSALGIGCRLTEDMGVLHFEKAFSRVKGLYQFVDQLCASRFFSAYRYINKESDMNVPGLAKAKKSYHPAFMVRSYCLAIK